MSVDNNLEPDVMIAGLRPTVCCLSGGTLPMAKPTNAVAPTRRGSHWLLKYSIDVMT
jgi:hypothetical protein